MTAVERAAHVMRMHPGIPFEIDNGKLRINASGQDGFEILVEDERPGGVLYCGAWHHHFDTVDELIRALEWVLKGECRVRAIVRGNTEHTWTLEAFEDGAWRPVSNISLLLFPYWARKRVKYYQNAWPRDSVP